MAVWLVLSGLVSLFEKGRAGGEGKGAGGGREGEGGRGRRRWGLRAFSLVDQKKREKGSAHFSSTRSLETSIL